MHDDIVQICCGEVCALPERRVQEHLERSTGAIILYLNAFIKLIVCEFHVTISFHEIDRAQKLC